MPRRRKPRRASAPPLPRPSPATGRGREIRERLVLQASLEAYGAIRHEEQWADRALDFTLRRNRNLYSNERRAVAERVYDLVRNERLLDHLLGQTRPGFFSLPSVHADALTLAAVHVLTGHPLPDALRSSLPAPEDLVALRDLPNAYQSILSGDRQKTFGLVASLPEFLAEKILREFGSESEALARGLNRRAPLTIRVNTLKISRPALLTLLQEEGVQARPTQLSPQGLIFETRINAFSLEAFKKGFFEVQDEGSQLLGMLVDAPPTRVLDACAGTGGKTLQLATQMKNRGEILALDVDRERLAELRQRARRAGVFNVRSRVIDADSPEEDLRDWVGKADRVLVDAPCSGSGTLRRKPDARKRINAETLAMHVDRQKRLLSQFSRLVKPAGQLIYGTCSVLSDENEQVIEQFLRTNPGWRLFPAGERLPAVATRGEYLKVLPHIHDTDGFFGAVLKKG